jgi:hypothetical protein
VFGAVAILDLALVRRVRRALEKVLDEIHGGVQAEPKAACETKTDKTALRRINNWRLVID